ncbi:MAG: hypothetical protein HY054_06135 [Proteobacteria bacterium]|nr:hypothetical protein [Pseudomonadota bacterium]HRP10358.1 hypothetical protein [Terricaulis sp.]
MTRPRKGRRVAFAKDDTAPSQDDKIAGLRFTIEPAHGGSVVLDFVDLKPRRLALAFAKTLRSMGQAGGALGARSTIKQHACAYRIFFAYLAETGARVRGPEDLRASHIDGFESWLEAAGKRPIHRHTLIAKPLQALRALDADTPSLLTPDLKRRLSYTSARPIGRSTPRDAYSPFVARQLREAARADIAAIARRVGSGPVSVAEGGGRQDLLDQIHAIIASDGSIPHTHRHVLRIYALRSLARAPFVALVPLMHSRHCMLAADLVPFLVLLSIETGLEIECLKALRVDCLKHPKAGTIEIHYRKRRARGDEFKHIRVRDAGPMTPGGVIRAILSLTERARRFHPSDSLWVYWRDGALRDVIKQPEWTVTAWVKRHNIRDDDGALVHLTLSRLRKTHKALWYLKSQGEIARFAVGHTPEVAARHYADIPSLRPIHEAAVACAFQEAHDSALKLRVVTPRQETALRRKRREAAALDAAQDVWLATCSGFTQSPHAPAGAPCPHAAWACLECPNAIITAAKLPALFAFLDFIESERAGLSAADWRAKFGQAHARITQQILPKFPKTIVAKAQSAPRPHLHLPIEVRG